MDPFPVNRKGKAGFKVCAGKNGLSAFSKKGTEKIRMGALWLETGRCPGDFIFCADGDYVWPEGLSALSDGSWGDCHREPGSAIELTVKSRYNAGSLFLYGDLFVFLLVKANRHKHGYGPAYWPGSPYAQGGIGPVRKKTGKHYPQNQIGKGGGHKLSHGAHAPQDAVFHQFGGHHKIKRRQDP